MHRHPWRRLLAWLIDWVFVLVWVGIVAAVGVPLYLAGVIPDMDLVALNVVAALLVIVPPTLALATLESGRWRATVGKRVMGVRVVALDGGRVSFGAALLRNALKVALPWIVGHATVFAFSTTHITGATPTWLWVLTISAYVLPIVYVVSLFVRNGRTPYDLTAGTHVTIA